MTDTAVVGELRRAIERSGYYPEFVCDALDIALAGEAVDAFLVQHETTFEFEELRRHITVVALTPTRLVLGHTDEHPADDTSPTPYASSTTEAVRIDEVQSVVVTRFVADPQNYSRTTSPREVLLTIGWGAVSRLDLEPATCGDPQCEADHGFTGTSANDDFSIRLSAAADGPDVVAQAVGFASALNQAIARR